MKQSTSSVHRCIKFGLSLLDPRSLQVIDGRYGLSGKSQTLKELSGVHGVSRERIRQIQVEALRVMRNEIQHCLSQSIFMNGAKPWQALAGHKDYVSARRLGRESRRLPPTFVLALELLKMELDSWLDDYAQPFAGGWLTPEWAIDDIRLIQTRMEEQLALTALPCALANLGKNEPTKKTLVVAVLKGLHTYGTYLVSKRPTARVQRAMRLHAILAELGTSTEILHLHREYRTKTPSDPCATRDCEIVMEAHQNLFLEVTEGNWSALGPAGEVPDDIAPIKNGAEHSQERSYESTGSAKQPTVCQSIIADLRVRGPSRISELMGRARDFLPKGRSVNSVAPILITRKDVFCRPLPGVYALHKQIPSRLELLETPPTYLLREEQVRIYALARRAGEPWGAYPLWLPETEYLWCKWAQKYADSDLLESVLSVAQIEHWPQVADKEAWRELVRVRGQFSIKFPPNPSGFVPPDLNLLLAACLYVQKHGYLGWISANRIIMRRAPENLSAGLLAVMVASGILAPDAEDWQAQHGPGPRLSEWLVRLEATRVKSGHLNWNSPVGRELKAKAIAAPLGDGWVSAEMVISTFKQPVINKAQTSAILDPLDQLLAERAKTQRSANRQATLRGLAKTS